MVVKERTPPFITSITLAREIGFCLFLFFGLFFYNFDKSDVLSILFYSLIIYSNCSSHKNLLYQFSSKALSVLFSINVSKYKC